MSQEHSDKDTFSKDDLVGSVEIPLVHLPLINYTFPLQLESGKEDILSRFFLTSMSGFSSTSDAATITISVGATIDYPSLCKKLSGWQGMIKNDHEKAILLPLPYSTEHWPVNGKELRAITNI